MATTSTQPEHFTVKFEPFSVKYLFPRFANNSWLPVWQQQGNKFTIVKCSGAVCKEDLSLEVLDGKSSVPIVHRSKYLGQIDIGSNPAYFRNLLKDLTRKMNDESKKVSYKESEIEGGYGSFLITHCKYNDRSPNTGDTRPYVSKENKPLPNYSEIQIIYSEEHLHPWNLDRHPSALSIKTAGLKQEYSINSFCRLGGEAVDQETEFQRSIKMFESFPKKTPEVMETLRNIRQNLETVRKQKEKFNTN